MTQSGGPGRWRSDCAIADGPPPLAVFTYDPAGNRLTKALENGITTGYTYDDAGRLVSVDNGAAGRFDYTYCSPPG